jgi:hypothetical protein
MLLPLSQLDEIENVGFECEAGKLGNSQAYRDVRDFAQTSLEWKLREYAEQHGKTAQFGNLFAVVFGGGRWCYEELTMGDVEDFFRMLRDLGAEESHQLWEWQEAKRQASKAPQTTTA